MRYAIGFDDSSGANDLPDAMREFNRRVDLLSAIYPNVSSRARDPRLHARVGGKKYSQHQLGLAADFTQPQWTREQVAEFMRRARRFGLVPVDEVYGPSTGTGPHMHVQMYPAGRTPRAFYRQVGVQISEAP